MRHMRHLAGNGRPLRAIPASRPTTDAARSEKRLSRDAVTGPASRTARYRFQDQGQVVDLPVLDPHRGLRDETVCWVGCVAGKDHDLRC